MTQETGPIYGIPLIDKLQVNNDGWIQKMPSRADLQWCQDAMSYRVAAGYEVLLAHYHRVCEERDKWKAAHELLTQSVTHYCESEVKRNAKGQSNV